MDPLGSLAEIPSVGGALLRAHMGAIRTILYLDLQSTQNNDLYLKMRGISYVGHDLRHFSIPKQNLCDMWAMALGTLEVQVI